MSKKTEDKRVDSYEKAISKINSFFLNSDYSLEESLFINLDVGLELLSEVNRRITEKKITNDLKNLGKEINAITESINNLFVKIMELELSEQNKN